MPEFEEPMSAEQVSKALGVTPKTIIKLAENGKIPGFRVGRLWKFLPTDIEAYINSQIRRSQDTSSK